MNKAIITGPTGLIGSALIQCLVEKDVEVYAVVRLNKNELL